MKVHCCQNTTKYDKINVLLVNVIMQLILGHNKLSDTVLINVPAIYIQLTLLEDNILCLQVCFKKKGECHVTLAHLNTTISLAL